MPGGLQTLALLHWVGRWTEAASELRTGPQEGARLRVDVGEIGRRVEAEAAVLASVRGEIGRVIVGQEALVDGLLLALLCNNHVLIEGVPGLAKTLSVTTLARAIQASFRRLQFTPDLLPADLIGTMIYSPSDGGFSTKKGPIFANIVLADEINRAPAKVQSALLEAMQERQVTIGEETYPLEGSVPGPGDAEPDRAGGHLPAAGGSDRPLHVQGSGSAIRPSRRNSRSCGAWRVHASSTRLPPFSTPGDIVRLRTLADEVIHGRQDRGIHRRSGLRRPGGPLTTTWRSENGSGTAASPRATIYLAMASRAPRHAAGPRVCHAAGRQVGGAGRAAPPRHAHLRSRSRGTYLRGHRPASSWTVSKCHNPRLARRLPRPDRSPWTSKNSPAASPRRFA